MDKLITLKKHSYLLIPIVIFLLVKVATGGLYVSDASNYFLVAHHMLHGQVLYRDIFFADLPLMPIIATIYFVFSFGNIWLFNFSMSLEAVALAGIIYYLVYRQTKSLLIPLLSASLFLLSGLVFLASASQTFIFSAGLLLIIGYLALTKKRFVLTGVLFALAFLTKAYFLPLICALSLATLIKYGIKPTLKIALGFLVTMLIVLLPFALFAGSDMWRDVAQFSLLDNIRYFAIYDLIIFFVQHEPLLLIFLVTSIIFIRRNYFIGLTSISFLALFFFYQGMKMLYFLIIIPYLCLYLADFYSLIMNFLKKYSKELRADVRLIVIPGIVILSLCYSLLFFGILGANQSKVLTPESITFQLLKEKPDYIYGSETIAPAFSYLTNIPLLDDQINTDAALYRKGVLDIKDMTNKALTTRTVFMSVGYLDSNGGMRAVDLIFDPDMIAKRNCSLINTYVLGGDLIANRIFLFKCYN